LLRGSLLMKIFAALAAVVCMAFFAAPTAQAQANQQIGYGIHSADGLGAHVFYAVSSTLHVGSGIGLSIQEGANRFMLEPYAKLFLGSGGTVSPFIFGQFNIMFGDWEGSGLEFGAGLQSWVSSNVGIFGSLTVLDLGLDPSYTRFGTLYPCVGVEFVP